MRILDVFLDYLEKLYMHLMHGNPTALSRWPLLSVLRVKFEIESGRVGLLNYTVAMLAKLAYIDGRASKEELYVVEDLLEFGFALTTRQKIHALEIFRKARSGKRPLQHFAAEYLHYYGKQRVLVDRLLEALAALAYAKSPPTAKQRECLQEAARILQVSNERLDGILLQQANAAAYKAALKEKANSAKTFRRYGKKVRREDEYCDSAEAFSIADAHYRVLGCKRSDAPERIKARYRRLALIHHPDRHAHKELPPEMMEYSVERFRRIQEAFEYVKKEKGFS